MIASYKCKETRKLKAEGTSRKFRAIERAALRKLGYAGCRGQS